MFKTSILAQPPKLSNNVSAQDLDGWLLRNSKYPEREQEIA